MVCLVIGVLPLALRVDASAQPSTAGVLWQPDFREAVTHAQEWEKQNLVVFTGIKWEEWSKRLDTEVLANPEFTSALAAHFVLTQVDLPETPQSEADLSDLEKRNYALAGKFCLQVFPSIYLCTTDGRPYGIVGYHAGGASAVVAEIDTKRQAYVRLVANISKFTGPERARAIDSWLESIPETLRMLHDDKIALIAASDPENITGLVSKYRIIQLLPEARRARYADDSGRAETLYLEILREDYAQGAVRQDLCYELADVYFQRRDYDALLDTLDKAIAAAPNGSRMPVLKEMMQVFTRQWIYTRCKPDEMKACGYDCSRIHLEPSDVEKMIKLIGVARNEVAVSQRNEILDRMGDELRSSRSVKR